MTALVVACAVPIAKVIGLSGEAYGFVVFYTRVLCLSLPFLTIMLAANACLRGAGDTLTPAVAMIVVDVVNMVFSFALTRGWAGLPEMGFRGIAVGTVIAYVAGGALQLYVLFRGGAGGRLRLHLHRLRPHWHTLKRILRIGLPSGMEGLLVWAAQFAVLTIINRIDRTNVSASAPHRCRPGRGPQLHDRPGDRDGRRDDGRPEPGDARRRAARPARRTSRSSSARGSWPRAGWRSSFSDETWPPCSTTTRPSRRWPGGAFSSPPSRRSGSPRRSSSPALRGAGDTFVVMAVNIASTVGLRLSAVVVVTLAFHLGLVAVWVVLASELTVRGLWVYLRFLHGGWRHAKV